MMRGFTNICLVKTKAHLVEALCYKVEGLGFNS
jgi:hypothetical protein